MRKLKQFCASLSLVIALSLTGLAGDLHTGAPAPLKTSKGDSSSTTGAVSEVNDATSVDPLAELALALLNGVLSIF